MEIDILQMVLLSCIALVNTFLETKHMHGDNDTIASCRCRRTKCLHCRGSNLDLLCAVTSDWC